MREYLHVLMQHKATTEWCKQELFDCLVPGWFLENGQRESIGGTSLLQLSGQ